MWILTGRLRIPGRRMVPQAILSLTTASREGRSKPIFSVSSSSRQEPIPGLSNKKGRPGAPDLPPADDARKLGEVDDVIFDQATGAIVYAVIDTGGWLASKKFIVPPQRLQASAQHDKDFRVNLTREQIEGFPPYDSA